MAIIAMTTRSSINVKPGEIGDIDRDRGGRDASISELIFTGLALLPTDRPK